MDVAINNLDMLEHEEEVKTIAVEIEVEDAAYFDLDVIKNNNAFRKYCIKKEKELKEQGKELVIEQSDKREAVQIYKCFFMDLFKQEHGYEVLSKTFSKENPPYGKNINGISYLGLPFLEKYICVNDNKYIINKKVIERELYV